MNKNLVNRAQFFSAIFIAVWLIVSFFNGVAPYLWPEIDFSIIYLIKGSLNIFLNILIAIWIILEARKYKFYPLIWGALAIFSGLLSVVLFYWILTFKELREKAD